MEFPKLFPEYEGLDEHIAWQVRGLGERDLVVVLSVFIPRFPDAFGRTESPQLMYALYMIVGGEVTGRRLERDLSPNVAVRVMRLRVCRRLVFPKGAW